MKRFTKMMAGVVTLGAVAIPAAAVVPALAADTPATTAPATTAPAQSGTPTATQHPTRVRGQKLLRRAAANKVAAQLGVTPDALRAAVKDARAHHQPTSPITDPTARRQYWLGQIADELHVTTDKLQGAVKAARQEIRSELLAN
jgi:hypothetical protein